jgi:peroxiredoxin
MIDQLPNVVPAVMFKTRVRDDSIEGPNPYRWQEVTSYQYFANKKVVLFALPGAFTPTCSTYQLPGFENNYQEFKNLGIDEIYCLSVNDSFVMNKWAESQNLKNVKVIPDGSGEFTSKMNMLVQKDNLGFGVRSWRYAVIVNNGVIEKWFVEPGIEHNCQTDPYGESSPENILTYLVEKTQ